MASNGNQYYLLEILAFVLKHLKEIFAAHLKVAEYSISELHRSLSVFDFYWVITIPSTWSKSSKQMIKQAAYMVSKMLVIQNYIWHYYSGWSLLT